MAWLVVLIPIALVCGMLGMAIGDRRGQGNVGFALGALLGPLGLLLALFLPAPVQSSSTSSDINAS
jgi:hypothetical protein